ncbi:MAG: hypothetical protein M1826_003206 [Phylliscum demangeonii]|nr:MAG: hypothetical protein M1826_003206 [Phylliscum demangeonii]
MSSEMMGEPSRAQLEAVPDPEAAEYAAEGYRRRSTRVGRKPDFFGASVQADQTEEATLPTKPTGRVAKKPARTRKSLAARRRKATGTKGVKTAADPSQPESDGPSSGPPNEPGLSPPESDSTALTAPDPLADQGQEDVEMRELPAREISSPLSSAMDARDLQEMAMDLAVEPLSPMIVSGPSLAEAVDSSLLDGTTLMEVDGPSAVDDQVIESGVAGLEITPTPVPVKAKAINPDRITFEEADVASQPPPGEELSALVEQAKADGLLRADYDTSAVRRVFGKLVVPPKCDRCIAANSSCDRARNGCWSCLGPLSCGPYSASTVLVPAVPAARFEFPGLMAPHRAHPATKGPVPVEAAKPPCVGRPPVWASSRHALCETLRYYRAFQSAAYLHEGLCFGMLFDRQGSDRDVITDDVLVTRCGGGMTKVDGEMSQTADQSSDHAVVQALQRCMKQKLAVVLILGNGNPKCPSAIPARYCVMDHFVVTKIWAEKAGARNIYMFRFEKLSAASLSWWAPATAAGGVALAEPIEATVATCLFCLTEEEQVYEEGWMCLNEACPAFWTIGRAPPARYLTHARSFLARRVSVDDAVRPMCPLHTRPIEDQGSANFAYSRACWKGIVCPSCGRCVPRVDWRSWVCPTPECGFVHSLPVRPLTAAEVSDPHGIIIEGHAPPTARCLEPIRDSFRVTRHYRMTTMEIPGCGTVTHIQANMHVNMAAGGPNDMFLTLQQADLGLKRFALTNSVVPEALTAHFALNYGMPYKYVVAVDSKSFAEAPPVILHALHRMVWAGRESIHDGTFAGFNELLTVGYYEDQKMGFHDDGESTLGPTIASLSLGCDATMLFRMKKSHYTGYTRAGVYKADELPLPGCREYESRLALYNDRNVHHLSAARRAELEKLVKRGKNAQGPAAIRMVLRHGDMIVMHGANIQRIYEHAVQPAGLVRFALTCRFVQPALVAADQHWKAHYQPDPRYDYAGDEETEDAM